MVRRFTPSRPSTRCSASGISTVELLVAMIVALAVTGAVVAVGLSSRSMYETDQNRTAMNQNLRSAIDLVGIDVRLAGALLPGDVPAIELVDGQNGEPDRLLLRRNLLVQVLPICVDIIQNSSVAQVVVARNVAPIPQGCNRVPDLDTNGWPDNMDAWRGYRMGNGDSVWAFAYNPTTRNGEFFEYDGEDAGALTLHRGDGERWQYGYAVADQARLYMLEQRELHVDDRILGIEINGDSDNVLSLIDDVLDFQARVFFRDGTVQTAMDNNDNWAGLEAIEVTIVGQTSFLGRDLERTLVGRFLPRNVLSL